MAPAEAADLFVLLQHGLQGNHTNLAVVEGDIRTAFADGDAAAVTLFSVTANNGLRCDAGVMVCADRAYAEMLPALRLFVGDGSGRRKLFSCVAHSFGGLINREVVKRLHADVALHDALTFLTFVTMATPHCGTTHLPLVMRWGAWAIGKVFSTSYLEVGLDGGKEGVVAGDMLSADHIAALQAFRHRVLVCNTCNDALVHFQGASLVFEERPMFDGSAAGARLSEHVLRPFAIGGEHDADGAPFPDDDSAARHIALTLRRAMTFTVVPIACRGRLPLAHYGIVSNNVNTLMVDVGKHVAQTMVADAC
jgi:hypothetical protein